MNRQPLRVRERLERHCKTHPRRPWGQDFRDGKGLDWMLGACCVAVPLLALAIILWGGR